MSNLFSHILNMSLTASVVILIVLIVRFAIRKAPKIFSYGLWSVVLFRLLCPAAPAAPISVLEPFSPEIQQSSDNVSIVSYLPAEITNAPDFVAVSPEESDQAVLQATSGDDNLTMTWNHAVALVWLVGAIFLMLYSLFQYLQLHRSLAGAFNAEGNIWLADNIDTAFVMGIFKPQIYLPSSLSAGEQRYILAHETHHIRRLDHIVKLIAYFALCMHWFNPLVWAAFVLAGKDMEMSCDEAVIKKLGVDMRADYSALLLRLSSHKRMLTGMPLAFGEGDTKSRIMNMAEWRKPAKWVIIICCAVCIGILAICALNPEKEKSIEEMTRRTVHEPVGTGIGDLYFTYPAGLTRESREVENWTLEEEMRVRRSLPNRGQFDHYFIDHGVDFGGVVDFILPENREIRLEELKLPSEWLKLDCKVGNTSYPYAESEYTLVKEGKPYIQMYLYTYSGRGYFLWFYTEQGDPRHIEAILNSVELGNGGVTKTRLKRDEEISLGSLNITIPRGYGYSRNETVHLNIHQPDGFRESITVGGVTARPNPKISVESSEDLRRWVEATGIRLDVDGLSYAITDESEYGDLSLSLDDLSQGIPIIEEKHYFFIAGQIVYDVWFDAHQMDEKSQKKILESVWLKGTSNVPGENKWITAAGASPVKIGQLPDGYNCGFDENRDIVFAWGNNAVGGVRSYPIPPEVYDPLDRSFFWLENMNIPDFEDDSLIYTGGMTSGDNGWVAEFASDVPPGTSSPIYRRHHFQVVGDTLYDIWFDMYNISRENMQEILSAIRLPMAEPAVQEEKSAEDIAYEKTKAIMDAVSDGSCHILSIEENSNGSPGYERSYLFHEGNYLYTCKETDKQDDHYALMLTEDGWYTREGSWDETDTIIWVSTDEPAEPDVPWLGNRVWVKSFVTYIDTVSDKDGVTYRFRYEKPFDNTENSFDHYWVSFSFDADGSFRNVHLQISTDGNNTVTITESILSLDPDTVYAEMQKQCPAVNGMLDQVEGADDIR